MARTSSQLDLTTEKDKPDTGVAESNESGITLDATLSYMSNILLEESTDEEDIAFEDGTSLRAMEKLFADIIGEKDPPSRERSSLQYNTRPQKHPTSTKLMQEHSKSTLKNIPTLEYNKGVEEGMKFVPSIEKLMLDFQSRKLSFPSSPVIKVSNGKSKLDNGGLDPLEGRNRKIPMSYSGEPVRDAKLDEVILSSEEYYKKVASASKTMKESTFGGEEAEEQYTDFKNLLVHCSQLIVADDHKAARDVIKAIRKQAVPDGDWNQRLALVLVDALEARINGTGVDMYDRCVKKKISTSDIVKVQYLFMTVSPMIGCTYYITKETILKSMEEKKAHKLHIIDFGIVFGFQWPSLIQGLSEWNGAAIKLKITGIDFPLSGFRPSEQVDESGRRLQEYARSFGVHLEYHGIASKWEDIRIEDLKIEHDELLVVNSMYRFRKLGDETVALYCPKDRVLDLIWRLKPHIFLYGIENKASSPFFATRFKQVMSYYATVFDMLDAFIPRDNAVRQLIERDMFARDVINLVACEGPACTEKPETFKQSHLRMLRAGFEQIPVNPSILEICQKTYKEVHDDRCFVEEESGWVLQGWRGKPLMAVSVWRPKAAV